jgi:hypothetical protein
LSEHSPNGAWNVVNDCALDLFVPTSHFKASLKHQAAEIEVQLALAKSSIDKNVTGDCSKEHDLNDGVTRAQLVAKEVILCINSFS